MCDFIFETFYECDNYSHYDVIRFLKILDKKCEKYDDYVKKVYEYFDRFVSYYGDERNLKYVNDLCTISPEYKNIFSVKYFEYLNKNKNIRTFLNYISVRDCLSDEYKEKIDKLINDFIEQDEDEYTDLLKRKYVERVHSEFVNHPQNTFLSSKNKAYILKALNKPN